MQFQKNVCSWVAAKTLAAATFAVWMGCGVILGWADEPTNKDLAGIVAAAKQYQLTFGPDDAELEFQSAPALRWPNATRGVPTGSTYIWTRNGRPEVMACLWYGDGDGLSFAFHSLSTSHVAAQRDGKKFWKSEKPGIELMSFPDVSAPADSETKRLTEMKDLARRFTCRLAGEDANADELRMLPTPLYRYKTDDKRFVDGALFAFVQGTDPEVILTIEAENRERGSPEWKYAITRRSMLPLEAKLDGKSVWSVPLGGGGPDEPFYTATFEQALGR